MKVLPYRDKVGLMVRVRFAGAVPRTGWLEVGFWLPRRIDSPRFHRVETIYPNAHVHRLRVTGSEQLDAQVAARLKGAYAVGCRENLGRAPREAAWPDGRRIRSAGPPGLSPMAPDHDSD